MADLTCSICGGQSDYMARNIVRAYATGAPAHDRCLDRQIAARAEAELHAAPALTVRVVDFRHGPRNARQLGAIFDAASKTWAIPAGVVAAADLARKGLALADAPRTAVSAARRGWPAEICKGCGRPGDDGECGLGHY